MITILYEDDNCIFINKPAGMSVHSDGKTPEYTVADWVLEQYPALRDVGEPLIIRHKGEEISVPKPGIVHRLDKETTGVMLIAKTQAAYEHFKAQFQARTTRKIYHAFCYGFLKEDEQTVSLPIGRSTGNIRQYTTGNSRGAIRDAETVFRVLKRFGKKPYDGRGSTEEGTYTFIEAEPKTGRTHQIRVHLRAINHPIVSDSLYASKRKQALGFTRFALHARSLAVSLPNGEVKTVEAPYPADFEAVLKEAA